MSQGWVFSKRLDLLTFGGSAALSLSLLALGWFFGWDDKPVHPGLFIASVVLVDVAHVWSTAARTYLDKQSFKRHRAMYMAVPAVGYLVSIALYSEHPLIFWRALAYLAVFHFVRQQWGWVKLSRLRQDPSPLWLDAVVIHTATLAPIAYWHAHLPRAFDWFIEGDFAVLSPSFAHPVWIALRFVFVTSLILYIIVHLRGRKLGTAWGKHLVLATTIALWWLGIVVFDSDYAFTVTNVFAHGIPYLVLLSVYSSKRSLEPTAGLGWARRYGFLKLLAAVWLIAWLEELLWDRTVWHDHSGVFGSAIEIGPAAIFWVPLLALPQLTHYILDGFIWRRHFDPWALR